MEVWGRWESQECTQGGRDAARRLGANEAWHGKAKHANSCPADTIFFCMRFAAELLRQLPASDSEHVSRAQRNNWPRCRPFMRHAISEDVPSNRRGLVTRGYWAWIFAAAGFCVDWLTITLMCASCDHFLQGWKSSCTQAGSAVAVHNCLVYKSPC